MSLVYTDQFIHRRYAKPGKIESLTVANKPVLDMLKKGKHSGSGKTFHEPVRVSNPQGLSASRSQAQAGSGGSHTGSQSVVGEWSLPYGTYTGGVEIDDKDIDAGGDVPNAAYLAPFGLETDGIIEEFGERMDTYILGEEGKAIGTFAGTFSTAGHMVLDGDAAESQILNFQVGQILQASTADGTSTQAVISAFARVIGVDYDALTVRIQEVTGSTGVATNVEGTPDTPTSWDGGTRKFIFIAGDYQGQASSVFIMDSFADWIPDTAPSSSNVFKGLDRFVNSQMSGTRLTSTQVAGLSNEERLKRLVTKVQRFGGGEKLLVLESIQWTKLASVLEARGVRPLEGKTANMSFQYLTLQTPGGMCKVIGSPKCRPDTAWCLDMKHWTLRTLSGFPKVMKGDGFTMIRKATADKYEFRIACYGHLSTPYPSRHGRTPIDPDQ